MLHHLCWTLERYQAKEILSCHYPQADCVEWANHQISMADDDFESLVQLT